MTLAALLCVAVGICLGFVAAPTAREHRAHRRASAGAAEHAHPQISLPALPGLLLDLGGAVLAVAGILTLLGHPLVAVCTAGAALVLVAAGEFLRQRRRTSASPVAQRF